MAFTSFARVYSKYASLLMVVILLLLGGVLNDWKFQGFDGHVKGPFVLASAVTALWFYGYYIGAFVTSIVGMFSYIAYNYNERF